MSAEFRVGEVAILIADASGLFPRTVGMECTITKPLAVRSTFPLGMVPCYGIRVQDGSDALAQPWELRRKPPASRGIESGSWDECPWQPEHIASTSSAGIQP